MYQLYECKTGKLIKGAKDKNYQKVWDLVEAARLKAPEGRWLVKRV